MLVCDTGVVYAALVPRDRAHKRCAELLLTTPEVVVLPAPILVEIDQLGHSRRTPQVTPTLVSSIEDGSVLIAPLDLDAYRRTRELVETYSDLPLGFVDAAVIAVAERLEETTIATLDRRHFSVVKPVHCEAFILVP